MAFAINIVILVGGIWMFVWCGRYLIREWRTGKLHKTLINAPTGYHDHLWNYTNKERDDRIICELEEHWSDK